MRTIPYGSMLNSTTSTIWTIANAADTRTCTTAATCARMNSLFVDTTSTSLPTQTGTPCWTLTGRDNETHRPCIPGARTQRLRSARPARQRQTGPVATLHRRRRRRMLDMDWHRQSDQKGRSRIPSVLDDGTRQERLFGHHGHDAVVGPGTGPTQSPLVASLRQTSMRTPIMPDHRSEIHQRPRTVIRPRRIATHARRRRHVQRLRGTFRGINQHPQRRRVPTRHEQTSSITHDPRHQTPALRLVARRRIAEPSGRQNRMVTRDSPRPLPTIPKRIQSVEYTARIAVWPQEYADVTTRSLWHARGNQALHNQAHIAGLVITGRAVFRWEFQEAETFTFEDGASISLPAVWWLIVTAQCRKR